MDEFTKAALDVVRLRRANGGNIYRRGKDDMCMLDVEANQALDRLVAAAPDPKERLIRAAHTLIRRWKEEDEKGILPRCDWSHEAKELWEAVHAYRRSQEGE